MVPGVQDTAVGETRAAALSLPSSGTRIGGGGCTVRVASLLVALPKAFETIVYMHSPALVW